MNGLSDDAEGLVGWLQLRAEPAPASLRARLAAAARAPADGQGNTLGDLLAECGERLLERLLVEGCGDRNAAPDLLAADALVTYAFEAAAEDDSLTASAIDASAARAMARVAALGATA